MATLTDPQIAATLHQAHLLSAKGKPFTNSMIHWIRYRYKIPAPVLKRPEEFTVQELARHFQIGIGVVHYWIQRGYIDFQPVSGRTARHLRKAVNHATGTVWQGFPAHVDQKTGWKPILQYAVASLPGVRGDAIRMPLNIARDPGVQCRIGLNS
jgi:hypothetical protein